MNINRDELLGILYKVKPALSNKEIIEQTNHFIFTGESIATYNDMIYISHPFYTDFQCTIKADEFYKIIQCLPDDSFDIDCGDDYFIKLKSGKSRARLASAKIDSILDIVEKLGASEIKKWTAIPENFIEAISFCIFSVSRDETKDAINCINIRDSSVSSTDNFRISQYKLSEDFKSELMMPLKAAIELVKYPITQYHISNSWVHFKADGGVIFSSRTKQANFPDVSKFLILKGDTVIFPKGILDALSLIKIAVGDVSNLIDQQIEIILNRKKVICRGEGSIGWVEQYVNFDYKGKEVSFFINPIFLIDILKKTNRAVIGEDRILFTSDNFSHTISLLKK